MSVENVKKYKEKCLEEIEKCGFESDESFEGLIYSMADCLIEQEERKKYFKFYGTEVMNSNRLINDSVVEVGQIWRDVDGDKKEYNQCFEVMSYDGKYFTILYDDGDIINYMSTDNLTCDSELITMDNIKEGEWIHDIHNDIKVKVLDIDYMDVNTLKIGDNLYVAEHQLKYYKPCLSPVENKSKLNAYEVYQKYTDGELFTQEDLDNAKYEGYNQALNETYHDMLGYIKRSNGQVIIDEYISK